MIKMDRVLFIVPPNIQYKDFIFPSSNVKSVKKQSGVFGSVITDIPLGVLSLSAYIKKQASVETQLLDFNVAINHAESFEFSSFTEWFNDIISGQPWRDYNPSIVCISALFSPLYKNMLDIARSCRDIFPDAVITAGGCVPTNMYKNIFNDSDCFDALCYGEGEKALSALVLAEDKFSCIAKHSSWVTRDKMGSQQHFHSQYIESLDEIPFGDFDIIRVSDYRLNPTIAAYTSLDSDKLSFPVMTSRGCTFRCCFCASHTVHGRRMRYHSIKRVREDIETLKEKYGAEIIIFQDDHFMFDQKRALEIIKIIAALKLTAFFPNSLALYALNREVIEALKLSGVKQLVLSIESGSDRVLKEVMHKPLNLSIVKRVADDCRDLGIYTDVNILIGLPGETKQDIEDARGFLNTVNANWYRVNVATPLIGSEMYDICVKNRYIRGDYLDCNYKNAIVETEDFSSEFIQEMAYRLNLELNFVNNSDYRLQKYHVALQGFENAIRAKSDHALAYYFASKCYTAIGNFGRAEAYLNRAKEIVSIQPFWKNYADMFLLELA